MSSSSSSSLLQQGNVFCILPYTTTQGRSSSSDLDVIGWELEDAVANTKALSSTTSSTNNNNKSGSASVVDDAQLHAGVLEVLGGAVSFPSPSLSSRIGSPLPYLVAYIRAAPRGGFLSLEVDVQTTEGTNKTLLLSTSVSNARVDSNNALLPLRLVDGWNRIVVNLQEMTQQLFLTSQHDLSIDIPGNNNSPSPSRSTFRQQQQGADIPCVYKSCERVRVFACSRVRFIFLADKIYAEQQLPDFLRIITPSSSSSTYDSRDL